MDYKLYKQGLEGTKPDERTQHPKGHKKAKKLQRLNRKRG